MLVAARTCKRRPFHAENDRGRKKKKREREREVNCRLPRHEFEPRDEPAERYYHAVLADYTFREAAGFDAEFNVESREIIAAARASYKSER